MPTLRQPAPPPGIPAGIPPMRKASAPPSQVPCKHFAHGNCSKGDKCEFAHEPKQQGRNASKSRSAPRATPPVCLMPLFLLRLVAIWSILAALPQLALPEVFAVHQCLAVRELVSMCKLTDAQFSWFCHSPLQALM